MFLDGFHWYFHVFPPFLRDPYVVFDDLTWVFSACSCLRHRRGAERLRGQDQRPGEEHAGQLAGVLPTPRGAREELHHRAHGRPFRVIFMGFSWIFTENLGRRGGFWMKVRLFGGANSEIESFAQASDSAMADTDPNKARIIRNAICRVEIGGFWAGEVPEQPGGDEPGAHELRGCAQQPHPE